MGSSYCGRQGWYLGKSHKLFKSGSIPERRNSGRLIPGSTTTTIGVFGTTHEWWRKVRGTCKGRVPETKETRRRGDPALVANLYQHGQVAEW